MYTKSNLKHAGQDLKKEKGWELDARLLGYAWGLQHSQDWGVET